MSKRAGERNGALHISSCNLGTFIVQAQYSDSIEFTIVTLHPLSSIHLVLCLSTFVVTKSARSTLSKLASTRPAVLEGFIIFVEKKKV